MSLSFESRDTSIPQDPTVLEPGLPHFEIWNRDRYCAECLEPMLEAPQRQTKLADRIANANTGCPMCGLVSTAVHNLVPANWHPQMTTIVPCVRPNCSFYHLTHLGEVHRGVELFIPPEAGVCSISTAIVRRDLRGPRQDRYLAIVSQWLDQCTAHAKCQQTETPLPTRVLDVGIGSSDAVNLYITHKENARYIALSHCWGPEDPNRVCTLTNNLGDMQRQIQVAQLPKTYRETVRIARDLHVRYVWIDSLCIIQNDLQDWAKESGDMAAIYGNAYVVIGATGAHNSYEGFLESHVETQDTVEGVPVATVRNDDGSVSTMFAQTRKRHHDNWSPMAWHLGKDRPPLASRAWCLQEQVLARRMILFDKKEMFWECRTCGCCECLEISPRSEYHTGQYKTDLEAEVARGSFNIWYEIVERYHERSLTYASDFLPALSGIATHLQSYGAGMYIAGLWVSCLSKELLWSVGHFDCNFRRAVPYRAPTWSWASLDMDFAQSSQLHPSLEFLDRSGDELEPACRFIVSTCTPVGQDKNGAVSAGEIVLKGKLTTFTAIPNCMEKRNNLAQNSEHEYALETTKEWLAGVNPGLLKAESDLAEKDYSGTTLYALLVGYTFFQYPAYKSIEGTLFRGLILVKTEGENDVFERVGTWRFSKSDVLTLDEYMELFNKVPEERITII